MIPRAVRVATLPARPVKPATPRVFSTSPTRPTQYRRFGEPPRQALPSGSGRQQAGGGGSQRPGWTQYGPLRNFRQPPKLVWVVGGGGTVYYVTHLEKVELTGRWRFMDTSTASELAMGEESYQQIMAENQGSLLPDNHPTARYVQKIASRIVQASHLDGGKGGWDCHVIQDDATRNAFVLPGGRIFVFTGILPICKNEDGLAVVLGHEIAHQVARHGAERMSSLKVLVALSFLLSSFGIDGADYIGLKLSTAACFDPREATGLWERMGAAEGEGGTKGTMVNVDFLSTHPSSAKRVEKVTEWAKDFAKERPESCGPMERQIQPFKQASRSFF